VFVPADWGVVVFDQATLPQQPAARPDVVSLVCFNRGAAVQPTYYKTRAALAAATPDPRAPATTGKAKDKSLTVATYYNAATHQNEGRYIRADWSLGGRMKGNPETQLGASIPKFFGKWLAEVYPVGGDSLCLLRQVFGFNLWNFACLSGVGGGSFGLHKDTLEIQDVPATSEEHKGASLDTFFKEAMSLGGRSGDPVEVDSVGTLQYPLYTRTSGYKPNQYDGCSLVWCCCPDYGPDQEREEGQPNFYGWLRQYFSEDAYAKDVLEGGPPRPVGTHGALRSPTLEEWQSLQDDFHVPIHFHLLRPGDMYLIRRGAFHLFVHAPGLWSSFTADVVIRWSSHRAAPSPAVSP
jgi:hypothetical protein